MNSTEKILITGALGQIGTELTLRLQELYGKENVLATDLKTMDSFDGVYETLDVLDKKNTHQLIDKYKITTVYHLAALLSGTSEKNPLFSWDININSLLTFLELAKEKKNK